MYELVGISLPAATLAAVLEKSGLQKVGIRSNFPHNCSLVIWPMAVLDALPLAHLLLLLCTPDQGLAFLFNPHLQPTANVGTSHRVDNFQHPQLWTTN